MESDILVVRVYLHEADHGKRKSLMQEVLNVLHDQHRVQGVIVFRGIAGFGEDGEVHASDLLRINVDLPVVIEFYDIALVAHAAIELLTGLVPAGHILCWSAVQHGSMANAPRAKS